MAGLSEALLASLQERMHEVSRTVDSKRAQEVIDTLDQVRVKLQ
jgi:hypothetical protein